MRKRMPFRPLGWAVALATIAAMSVTMAIASSGGAATPPEKVYSSTFEAPCVVGPGSLNISSHVTIGLSGEGPTEVTTGQEFALRNAHSTITSPVELTESFVGLGANEVKGKVNDLWLEAIGAEPKLANIAKVPEYLEGLPFFAPVEEKKEAVFSIPSKKLGETNLTYTGPTWKVTATSGNAELRLNGEKGFTEPEPGRYKETGEGIESEVEGRLSGSHIIGPLPVVCNVPVLTIASIPLPAVSTSSTTSITTTDTTTSAPLTTTTTTTTTTSSHSTTTTTTTSAGPVKVSFKNWVLKGSVTDKKVNEAIKLPNGCTFNGEAEVPGKLEGNTSCPGFKASLKVNGSSSTLGLNLTESEAVKGTISSGKEGKLLFKATAKDNLSITSLSILGLTLPTSCKTTSPISFPLEAEAPATALVNGQTFTGETTLPTVTCSGGFLGAGFGPIITSDFSGSGNKFSLTIEP